MPPKDKYEVVFKNEHLESEIISADSAEKAVILARAEKIKRGLDDRVDYVNRLTYNAKLSVNY